MELSTPWSAAACRRAVWERPLCKNAYVIAFTILYPRTDDLTFDMDYYTSSHMPMLAECLGDSCRGWGAAAIAEGKYAVMGWAMVTSRAELDATRNEHGAKMRADVANYTNVQPDVLIGEITGGSD